MPDPKPQFNLLEEQIAAHWLEHRPRMVRDLRKAGKFEESVRQAADQTNEALKALKAKGLPHNQAWELVREEWAFLPSESDQPHLGLSREALTAPTTPATTASPTATPSGKAG